MSRTIFAVVFVSSLWASCGFSAIVSVDHLVPGIDPNDSIVTSYYAPESESLELHIIGVYEAQLQHAQDHMPGDATIHVRHDGFLPMKPIVLLLSSYEPVRWIMDIESDANIQQILLNGYHDQVVLNAGDIPIRNRSPIPNWLGYIAYQWPGTAPGTGSPNTGRLIEAAERIARVPLTSFTGVYRADEFTLLGTPVPEPPCFIVASTLLFVTTVCRVASLIR